MLRCVGRLVVAGDRTAAVAGRRLRARQERPGGARPPPPAASVAAMVLDASKLNTKSPAVKRLLQARACRRFVPLSTARASHHVASTRAHPAPSRRPDAQEFKELSDGQSRDFVCVPLEVGCLCLSFVGATARRARSPRSHPPPRPQDNLFEWLFALRGPPETEFEARCSLRNCGSFLSCAVPRLR